MRSAVASPSRAKFAFRAGKGILISADPDIGGKQKSDVVIVGLGVVELTGVVIVEGPEPSTMGFRGMSE